MVFTQYCNFGCKITTIFSTDNVFFRIVCEHKRIFDIGQR